MSTHGDGGKGSGRRQEDVKKIHDNWDLIFGAKVPKSSPSAAGKPKEKTMNKHDEDIEQSEDDEWTCEMCGGPMYRQAHWSYGQCDDCGARQELESDY